MKKIILLLSIIYACQVQAQAQTSVDTFSYQEILDLPYLAPEDMVVDSLQCLNLVLPQGVDSAPLLLWIGGGAWSFVNRHMEMNLARKFARAGIAVASVGHQLSKGTFAGLGRTHGVQHPTHIKDIAAAFKWLQEHAEEYGYDQNNIFVGGFSSGAHLSALLAMDERYLKAHGLSQDNIKGILPVAGAYDISHYHGVFLNNEEAHLREMADTHVKDVFGDTEEAFIDASPSTYMDNLKTPMLLISEGALFNYTKVFEEKIWDSAYRDCQILHVFDQDHGGLWRDLSNAPDSSTRKVMIDFILSQAKE